MSIRGVVGLAAAVVVFLGAVALLVKDPPSKRGDKDNSRAAGTVNEPPAHRQVAEKTASRGLDVAGVDEADDPQAAPVREGVVGVDSPAGLVATGTSTAILWGHVASFDATPNGQEEERGRRWAASGADVVWWKSEDFHQAWDPSDTQGLKAITAESDRREVLERGLVHQRERDTIRVKADLEGRFRIEGIPVGQRGVVVVSPTDGVPQAFEFIALQPAVHRRDFELVLDQVLETLVVDLQSNEPIAGVVAEVVSRSGDVARRVRLGETGDDGEIRILHGIGDRLVRFALSFEKKGYSRIAAKPIEESYVVGLHQTRRVYGVVVDTSGTPQRDVRVLVSGVRTQVHGMPPQTTTAADGSYEVLVPFSDEICRVRASRRRFHGPVSGDPPPGMNIELGVIPGGAWGDLRLDGVMAPIGVITGVLRAGGHPISGELSWRGGQVKGRATADKSGTYSIGDLAVGPVQLIATISNPTRTMEREVNVHSLHAIRVDFDFPAPKGEIAGNVVTAEGSGVAGVAVVVEGDDQTRYVAETDRDGRFRVAVPPDPSVSYRVSITDRGKVRTQFSIRAGAGNVLFKVVVG